MPRLDARRLSVWRDLSRAVDDVSRRVDADLQREWAVPVGSFDVLVELRECGGAARPQHLADLLSLPRSSVSRRLDRLEEEGWVVRRRDPAGDDHRAVLVELTPRGRILWREMNVSYRRAVQRHFAGRLDDDAIDAAAELAGELD